MGVIDAKMDKAGKATLKAIRMEVGTTATGQTDLLVDSVVPAFPFVIERVEAYCKTITAALTVDVLIDSTSVLQSAITPVADTPTAGTLVTAKASRKGGRTSEIRLRYTSDGTGAATRARVTVWVRPYPLNGEAL